MLFGKFHNKLVNYGYTDEDYAKMRPNIIAENQKNMLYVSLVCLFYMIAAGLFSFLGWTSSPHWVFFLCAVPELLNYILTKTLVKKNNNLLKWIVYFTTIDLVVLGTVIGVFYSKDQLAVSFPCFLILAPLVFSDRPYRICTAITTFMITFIIADFCFKGYDSSIFRIDLFNTVIFGTVSMVISIYLGSVKLKRFWNEVQVDELAHFDLLTGIQNRNCYEKKLSGYEKKITKSIACYYIDSNGLHSINNKEGHAAGDALLKKVASILVEEMGIENCYRIGGDEFVGFILDKELLEVNEIKEHLLKTIEMEGYHFSVGYEYQTIDSYDVQTLIKNAEAYMYKDKEAYYNSLGIEMR